MDEVKAAAIAAAIGIVCLFGFCWKACSETCKSYRDCIEHNPGHVADCGSRC